MDKVVFYRFVILILNLDYLEFVTCCPSNVRVYTELGGMPVLNFSISLDPKVTFDIYRVSRYDGSTLLSLQYEKGQVFGKPLLQNCSFASTAIAASGILDIILNNVTADGRGTYYLRKGGQKDPLRCYTVYILGSPIIPSLATNGSFYEGTNLRISCTSTSTTLPSNHSLSIQYNWAINGSSIASGGRFSFDSSDNKELTIYNISRNDRRSVVRCTATEVGGKSSQASEVTLNVFYGPENIRFLSSGPSLVLTNGDTFNPVTCIADCNEACTFTWKKQNGSGSSFTSSNATLDLGLILPSESGIYICTATHMVPGHSLTKTLNVSVIYGPDKVSISPSKTTYTMNEGLTLNVITCSAPCYPNCTFVWKKAGLTVSSNARLDIGQVDRNDDGNYTCTALNPTSMMTRDSASITIVVTYGPEKIRFRPNVSSVTLNDGASFNPVTCLAYCNPKCSFYWTKQNETDSNVTSSNATLDLNEAIPSKSGNYMCTATHTITGDSLRRTLNVSVIYGPDKVLISPSKTTYTLTEGDIINVTTCSASCFPQCAMTWMKTGKLFSSSTELNLGQVEREDAGVYVCIARNPSSNLSQASANITVAVRFGPDSITLSPSAISYSLMEGEPLQPVSCTASCFPPCTFVWSQSGATVSSDERLDLGHMIRSEAGKYICTASNSATNVTLSGQEVELIVIYGPDNVTLTPSIENYTFNEGYDLEPITCFSDCLPTCSYTWKTSKDVIVNQTAILDLKPLDRSKMDEYQCDVINVNSSKQESGSLVAVNVRYGPDTPTLNVSKTTTVTEGDTIQILCSANCWPACVFRWKNLTVDTAVTSTSLLQISPVSRWNSGTYRCIVNNPSMDILFETFTEVELIVHYPPDVIIFSSSKSPAEGENFTMVCVASGVPAIYDFNGFEQKVGDVVVYNNNTMRPGQMANMSVQIPLLHVQDTGTFTCRVSNGIPDVDKRLVHSASFMLQVRARPIIFFEDTIFHGDAGYDLFIHCSFYSHPEMSFYYIQRYDGLNVTVNSGNVDIVVNKTLVRTRFYDENVILHGHRITVHFKDLTSEDFGRYVLFIENAIGTQSTEFSIISKSKVPTFNINFIISCCLGGIGFVVCIVFLVLIIRRRPCSSNNKDNDSDDTVRQPGGDGQQYQNLSSDENSDDTVRSPGGDVQQYQNLNSYENTPTAMTKKGVKKGPNYDRLENSKSTLSHLYAEIPDRIGATQSRLYADIPDRIGATQSHLYAEIPDRIGATQSRLNADIPERIGTTQSHLYDEIPDKIGNSSYMKIDKSFTRGSNVYHELKSRSKISKQFDEAIFQNAKIATDLGA
ncbi:basement membrane-specific heparan sulfate proteoglycan core protein-like [Mya arenaria]|uniref:basement membrane-specific heparan sulfate proteoglycan core protein-like n=1 Tax=Mya arenaria TaxID=6604 RepID=UPI0022E2678A|nr:basement membrane-specific heparan sulfate proteoglycan core protein-like [Mya arenaria]